ncbi:MAG: hypothetical protein MAG431_00233 [Chloroflexi bacterium]|nr:hypothetical protein [Chloroflexota bacterium]
MKEKSSKPNHPLSAYFALGIGILSLGFSAIFVREAGAPGTVTAFYRMAIGSLAMTVPFGVHRHRQGEEGAGRSLPRPALGTAMLGGVFFAADLTLWATGIVISGATIPTLMANTAPLWVGLGAWWMFKEKLPPKFWGGLALALVGAGVLLGHDFSRSASFGMGSLLGLGAAVFYGVYLLATQPARAKLDTITYHWVTTSTSALVLLLVNVALKRTLWGYPLATYLYFLAVGIVVQVFGWMAVNYAQGYLPASLVSPTLLIQPVLTALIAWPLLGETLTSWHLLGGVAVIGGVYLVHRSRQGGKGRG